VEKTISIKTENFLMFNIPSFGVFAHHCTQYYWCNQCKISWSSILLHPSTLINVSLHNQWWTSLFHKLSVIGREHLKVVIKLRWQQESRCDNIKNRWEKPCYIVM
jgi:hypothetical protein